MPQYLMSVWHDAEYEVDFSSPEAQRMFAQVGAFNDELTGAGMWVFGAGLQPASTATVLRASAGGVSMTDGPYAETKEQIGGILILEARDLDHAIEIMSKHPGVKAGPFEIRPAADLAGMIHDSETRRASGE